MRTVRAMTALLVVCAAVAHAQPKRPAAKAKAADKITTATVPAGLVTLRVDLRCQQKARAKLATQWDGRVTVSRGTIRGIEPLFADPRDAIEGTGWKISTQRVVPWSRAQRDRGYDRMPYRDSGLVLELTDVAAQTKLSFETAQGNFEVALGDVPMGRTKGFLNDLAAVSRMANAVTMLSAPTEDDFPSAAAAPGGKVYVAYVAFTHGEGFRSREPIATAPADFAFLGAPTGGDQVLLLCLDGGKCSGPMPVTPTGQDVYRTATAVDGQGRCWVFWTAKEGDQWDLFARCLAGGTWAAKLRLTDDAGPDLFPVAATDKAGKAWVAWQAFRGGQSRIMAAVQDGDGFATQVVSNAPGNEWTPAIAAAADGRVAVAWDTYAKGDYDVYCRVWAGGKFGEPVPVATTYRGEMRPSIAFDAAGRLWIAYEDSPEKWGKDQGAVIENEGVGLYRARLVGVRVWADGKLHEPADDPVHGFQPSLRGREQRPTGLRLAVPRLAADASGRVWLAVRTPLGNDRSDVGTVWSEQVTFYEGGQWSAPILCPKTDHWLDNRPALLARPDGGLRMFCAADGREATTGSLPSWLLRQLRGTGEKVALRSRPARWPDPVNSELSLVEIDAPPGRLAEAKLTVVPTPSPGKPQDTAAREAGDVARAQAARVTVGGKELRLYRGEFHRHTEISYDGGGDGLLLDMWRYALDVAGFDWIGNGDHDNGGGREYSWWLTQKTTDLLTVPGAFVPMYSYERSCSYPDGHRNPVFAKRGMRTLPRLRAGMGKAMDDLPDDARRPSTPDTQMLYAYLRQLDGVCASHTSGTDMGTDWRNSDRKVEPVVEIYQGCRQSYEMPGAPRSPTAQKALGGWRPLGFVSRALKMGLRLGFQSSSDHGSTHISYCNVWVEQPTREAILTGLKRRHVYGATDNIVAIVTCGEHFMGDEFATDQKPKLSVKLVGTAPFAKVHVIKDNQYVHTIEPGKAEVEFDWTDFAARPGATSYYYVRGEQSDGELVWVSPMWITLKP